MCGIAGYVGKKKAAELLLKSIKNLEYRGYDSVGMATIDQNTIHMKKGKGKVSEVDARLDFSSLPGSTGIGHCLHPNTYVQLSDGRVCRVSEVMEREEVNTLDFGSLKLDKKKCSVMRHSSPRELYEIRTAANSLVCTGEHKMFVARGVNITEKKAKELEKGDLLLCVKRTRIDGDSQPLEGVPVKRYYEYSKGVVSRVLEFIRANKFTREGFARSIGLSSSTLNHFLRMDRNLEERYRDKICKACGIFPDRFTPIDSIHGKNACLPTHTSEGLLQFLGYLLGDGYVGKRSIRFKDNRRQILIKYANLARELFNLKGRIVKLSEADAFLLEINSKFVCDWIRFNFIEVCRSGKSKAIPAMVGRVPDNELRGFVRGLFDAEAACASKSHQISLRMKNEGIIRIMQFFLLRFGVLSSFSIFPTKWGPAYSLNINTANDVSRFLDLIGFDSSDKLAKARTMLSEMKPGISYTYKPIPMRKDELRSFCGIKSKVLKGGPDSFLTELAASRFLEELGTGGLSEPHEELSRFVNGDVFFQEIRELKKIPSDTQWVYDLHVPGTENFIANCLVSHNSRWATHGKPSEQNAHPHFSSSGKIVIAHNGIIENYLELKEELKDYEFKSDTDSEVISHLLEKNYSGNLKDALLKTVNQLTGTYAICAIHVDSKEIVVARNGSPLAIGIGEEENFIGSDVSAFVEHTKKVIYLDDFEVASVKENSVEVFGKDGEKLQKEIKEINWDVEKAQKQGYKHFMLKEIHEQPKVVQDSLSIQIPELKETPKRIFLIACGTAAYAGLVGKYILEKYTRIPVEVAPASEFRYSDPVINSEELFISISQSGETADTLAALRLAKQKGAKTLGIINVQDSTIARESDSVIYTRAGPEIGVASTKAFISQLVVLYKLAASISKKEINLSEIPDKIQSILNQKEKIRKVAEKYFRAYNFLYIGRGLNFPIALEGALKLKEISYIHAEGYASGEMKHGPIALVCDEVPTVALAPKDSVYPKTVSNMQEIMARNGKIIAVATEGDKDVQKYSTDILEIPETKEELYPLLSVISLQLLAYYIADFRDCDIDKPRNLAKSVTVE